MNHQNFIAPNSNIRYQEQHGIFSDAEWMETNIKTFGLKMVEKPMAKFYYGGVSTRPSMKIAIKNLRFDKLLKSRIKFFLKAMLISLGAEWITKIILKRKYL